MKRISIAKDFTKYPYGRYLKDGPNSAQRFRDEILIPILNANELIEIDLDGTAGFGSSFLEEVFGGAVRKGIAPSVLEKKLSFISKDDISLIDEIWGYIKANR